jgi:hypothetical protein
MHRDPVTHQNHPPSYQSNRDFWPIAKSKIVKTSVSSVQRAFG